MKRKIAPRGQTPAAGSQPLLSHEETAGENGYGRRRPQPVLSASPAAGTPHTTTAAAPPPPGSPLPAAGRWKPMMRLIRSSEFISSFLRLSSARRWEAERPAGAPGGAGTAPAPPPSSIPGRRGRGVTSAPHNGAAPPQRAGASAARLQPLKQAPPSRVRAGGRGTARGEPSARRAHWPDGARTEDGRAGLGSDITAREAMASAQRGGGKGAMAAGRRRPSGAEVGGTPR